MTDVIYLALAIAFFAVAVGLVRACEHIIGPDELGTSRNPTPEPAEAPVP